MRERDFEELRGSLRREVTNDEFEKRQLRFMEESQAGRGGVYLMYPVYLTNFIIIYKSFSVCGMSAQCF
jgi:hypothetical protein